MTPDESCVVDCPPVDLRLTLGPIRRGSADPTTAVNGEGWWWATRTGDGPATLRIAPPAGNGVTERVLADAWGPGATEALERVPGLVGAHDPVEEFDPHDDRVARLARGRPGERMARTDAVFEALVPTILGQKVIGKEAKRSFRRLIARHGTDAPGPSGLRLQPRPEALAALPYHEWHPLGVERRRAEVVARAAKEADRLERDRHDPVQLRRRLLALPGIADWTIASVFVAALGDPDAVIIGDHNLPHTVAWLLAGEPRADDARMLELLEPFAGHRARVQALAKRAGPTPPRRGPKLGFREIERT